MEAMVDTVAREKPKLPQLHTMADTEDMVVDMEAMVDTVAREKPKLPQLHTMADMEDMVVDMEVMVDIVAREKPKLPQLHTMADMAFMGIWWIRRIQIRQVNQPSSTSNPRISRHLSTLSH